MAYRAAVIIVALVIAASTAVYAGGSMFSANGVGEEQVGGGVRALGLGGGAFGMADTLGFNSLNPALLAFLPRTAMRLGGHVAFWNTTANGVTDSDAELAWKDVGLFLPLTHRWRFGLGIQPTRRQDLHTIAIRTATFPRDTTVNPPIPAVTEPYEERLTWSGSTIDVRLDNAYRFSDRFALGVGAIYSFLHDERNSTLDFQNTEYRDVRIDEVGTFRGWSFSLGGYYAPSTRLSLGGFFRPRMQGNWTSELGKVNTDSTVKNDGQSKAPGEFALGVSYGLTPQITGVADVRMGMWEAGDYGIAFQGVNTPAPNDPLFLSAGIERQARRAPVYSGFNLWGYRAGAFYRQHYWTTASGEGVKDVGLSLGFSIPVAQSSGWIHGAAEFGQRGFDEKKLGATELFGRFSFQLEVGETWFQRSKPRLPE